MRALMTALVLGLGVGDSVADETFARLERKTTMVSATSTGTAGQQLEGYWWWDENNERSLYRLDLANNGEWLLIHSGANPRVDSTIRPNSRHLRQEGVPGVLGQLKYDGRCFSGLVRTVEVREPYRQPECPQYYWWTRASMCLQENRSGGLRTSGFRHDSKTCYVDQNRPQSLEARMERYLGAAFVPIRQGAYIRILAVAAPAQYGAEVRIAWDYRAAVRQTSTQPVRVEVTEEPDGSGPAGRKLAHNAALSGAMAIPYARPGRTTLIVKVIDSADRELHHDRLIATIPRIPGIN